MLIYGKNALLEALKANIKIKEIFLRDGVKILNNVNLNNLKVNVLKKNVFDLKFPEKNQGIVADIDYNV